MGMMPRGFLYFEMSTAPHSASAITPSKTAIAISVAITFIFCCLSFSSVRRETSAAYIFPVKIRQKIPYLLPSRQSNNSYHFYYTAVILL